jgi:VanZ family protein
MQPGQRRRSGLTWLALGYLLLIVYASLHPFAPWDWPKGLAGWDVFRLAWPQYWSQFDIWANAAGYLPLGLLVFAAAWRSGLGVGAALLLAALLPSLTAYSLEILQRFVALRVPSLADWVLNSGGALLGALLGAVAVWRGWLLRWGQWRERFFQPQSAGALALLALWPLGLLFPLPAPLAQGRFLPPLLDSLEELLNERLALALDLTPALGNSDFDLLLATLLGLLAPCLLLLAVARPGWQRLPLLASVLMVGIGMSSLAAALGFGPANTWAWLTPRTVPALLLGALLVSLCAALPARANAVLALPVLTGLILVVTRTEADPYLLLNLQRWELGTRVQLYGLLQWLGWLWPLLTLGWLMFGLTRGGEPRIAGFSPGQRR